LVYAALIVYASLYPFADWRDQGIWPWAFLAAPLPRYWTWFDVVANVLGYVPLGFLLALAFMRSGRGHRAVLWATALVVLLSLLLEMLQGFLPMRVPSHVDWALNAMGGWLGACLAWALQKWGVIDRWSHFRARWFVDDARGALALLVLWPLALLYPAAVPLGLGQVFERLEATLGEVLADTPFLEWMPVREMELQPLVPAAEVVCVLLGALIPCLLAYCIIRPPLQRLVAMGLLLLAGMGATALSAALSYGPTHAWGWLSLPVRVGLWAAPVLGLALAWVPRRGCAAVLLLVLVLHLSLLNQAPASAYFSQALQTWEQGRFIRFHGLVQWLGWLWPFVAMLYVVLRFSRREQGPGAGS
jgi:VanZ family protein